jgi:hypothetical protein
MPSDAAPTREDLDRLAESLDHSIAKIFREWNIPEAEGEEIVGEVLVRLAYRWNRIYDPEGWLLQALSREARSRSERSLEEQKDD